MSIFTDRSSLPSTPPSWLRNDDTNTPLAPLVQPRPIPDPVLDTDCPVCLESPEYCPGDCGPLLLAESGFYSAPEFGVNARRAA